MDRHKSLYKENSSVLSPRQTNRMNRELLNANRAKQRRDLYTSTRNMSTSPSPSRGMAAISATSTPAAPQPQWTSGCAAEEKENIAGEEMARNGEHLRAPQKTAVTEAAGHSTRIAKVACTRDSTKLSRQETFLMRFIEWKDRRKQEEAGRKKPDAQRPFLPAGNADKAVTKEPMSSFAPKNHQFKAPEGLQNPAKEGPLAFKAHVKLRKSLYTALPTPPRKSKPEPQPKRKPPISLLARATVNGNAAYRTAKRTSSSTTATTATARTTTAVSKKTTETKTAPTKGPLNGVNTDIFKKKPPLLTLANTNMKRVPIAAKAVGKTANDAARNPSSGRQMPAKRETIKPRALMLPPPPPRARLPAVKVPAQKPKARIVKPLWGVGATDSNSGGAIRKAKVLESKRNAVATQVQPTQKSTKLSVNMKAKKPAGGASVRTSTAATVMKRMPDKFKGMTLLTRPLEMFPLLETPTEVAGPNPFAPTVTSTNVKYLPSDYDDLLNVSNKISPVELPAGADSTQPKRMHGSSSSAKRELMPTHASGSAGMEGAHKQLKDKFKFVRYSEANTEFDMTMAAESPAADVTAVQQQPVDETIVVQNGNEDEGPTSPSTPKRAECPMGASERPANYLSPFVSVSRGKVNARVEQHKRNSVYLQSTSPDGTPTRGAESPEKTATPVEVRRILETVRYFRKQLADEIARLHVLCDRWEAYKDAHLQRVQETGGEDMINVTIGQTRLLTSKKFMQFNGLIDRCEAAAKGEAPPDDGSEATKAITAVDLEGFWSMLGLQVDNLDKRFANLERWRANDWVDPDEAPALKVKKTLTKVKKAKAGNTAAKKAKPSSALQQMMRKMQAEMRRNKAGDGTNDAAPAEMHGNVAAAGEDVVLTPTRSQAAGRNSSRCGTPTTSSGQRRRSILVRDRKSFSAAATVLTITQHRASSLVSTQLASQECSSPKLQAHLEEFTSSLVNLRAVCEGNDLRKTALMGAEQKKRRMSVLASPCASPAHTKPSAAAPFALCTPGNARSRKSILKTPGTAKSKPKSVFFEQRVKQYKFTVGDSDDTDEEEPKAKNRDHHGNLKQEQTLGPHGEAAADDGEQRTYKLRTRKVILRPSSEFVIPK